MTPQAHFGPCAARPSHVHRAGGVFPSGREVSSPRPPESPGRVRAQHRTPAPGAFPDRVTPARGHDPDREHPV